MVNFRPPVSFYFKVTFENLPGFTNGSKDVMFQSVSGLDAQIETETYKESGMNECEHELPVRTKYTDLVLKRGVLRPEDSALTDWFIMATKNMIFQPINITILLLNETGDNLMYWKVIHAWPKSWKFGDLDAEKSAIFLETLTLNYNRYEFKKGAAQ